MATKKTKLPVVYDPALLSLEAQQAGKSLICNDCELKDRPRVVGSGAPGFVDIMLVSESPSSWSVNNKDVFLGRGGMIIRKTWNELCDEAKNPALANKFQLLTRWGTYAVQCQVETGRESVTTPAAVVARCALHLHTAITTKRPKVIVAFGSNALKSLGFQGTNFMDVRGRTLDMNIGGHTVQVIPTFSTKHLMVKTGLHTLFYNDVSRAMRLASGVDAAMAQMTIEEVTKGYKFPSTVEEVTKLCTEMISYVVPGADSAAACAIAVDTETNTLHPQRADAKVLCVSFAWDMGKSTAIPLWHKDAPWTEEELPLVVEQVKRVLECAKPKVLHNAKFDLKFLELRHGMRVNNVAWDSMLGEHLLREDQSGSYSLKVLGRSYFPQFANYADHVHEIASALSPEQESIQAVIDAACVKLKKGQKLPPGLEECAYMSMPKEELTKYLMGSKKDRKKSTFDSGYERVPLQTLLTYAAIDTDLTRMLYRHQFIRMRSENFMAAKNLMQSHALPASRTLGKMEFGGMAVDIPYLNVLAEELAKLVAQKGEELQGFWREHDRTFNPNSTADIAHVLFNQGVYVDGVPQLRFGPWVEMNVKSGKAKTDKKTLRAIAETAGCPFAKALLEYRAAHKALSGFIHDIQLLAVYDGRLHTNFHIHGTSTGRLSSSDLNMQNLPAWLAKFNIKKIFIPDDPEEEVVFNLDWKGAEIRVFTAYAPDKELIKALNDGLDVHSYFTQEIFGIPYAEVEAGKEDDKRIKNLRTTVKRVVFGVLYGAMAKKIAETAGVTEARAQEIIDKLFIRFESLRRYMEDTVRHIHQHNFVETLFNRRRRFPLASVNGFFRGQAERRGKNMKIQSTSSDIVISQLCEVDEHLHELGGRLCLTVHDSIVGTVKKKNVHKLPEFFNYYCVQRVAEKFPWLPVSFACDLTVGPSYGEQMSVEKYLQQAPELQPTAEESWYLELEEEAINELREDEEEANEQAALAAVKANLG